MVHADKTDADYNCKVTARTLKARDKVDAHRKV